MSMLVFSRIQGIHVHDASRRVGAQSLSGSNTSLIHSPTSSLWSLPIPLWNLRVSGVKPHVSTYASIIASNTKELIWIVNNSNRTINDEIRRYLFRLFPIRHRRNSLMSWCSGADLNEDGKNRWYITKKIISTACHYFTSRKPLILSATVSLLLCLIRPQTNWEPRINDEIHTIHFMMTK